MVQHKQAFTLIELLVVVLIIGILVAVAVPQYQTAIDKVRYTTMFALVKNIAQDQKIYRLVNGAYSNNLRELDADKPSSCTSMANNISCPHFDVRYNTISFFVYGILTEEPGNSLVWYLDKSEVLCLAYVENGERAKRLCKAMGGINKETTTTYTAYSLSNL